MSTKKKIEKELEKENIIKEIKKAQTDVAVAEKFFQFVSDPELVDVAIYNLEAKKSRYRYLIKLHLYLFDMLMYLLSCFL